MRKITKKPIAQIAYEYCKENDMENIDFGCIDELEDICNLIWDSDERYTGNDGAGTHNKYYSKIIHAIAHTKIGNKYFTTKKSSIYAGIFNGQVIVATLKNQEH